MATALASNNSPRAGVHTAVPNIASTLSWGWIPAVPASPGVLLAATAGAAVPGVEVRGVVSVVIATSPSPRTFAVPVTTFTDTVVSSPTKTVLPWGMVNGPLVAVRSIAELVLGRVTLAVPLCTVTMTVEPEAGWIVAALSAPVLMTLVPWPRMGSLPAVGTS